MSKIRNSYGSASARKRMFVQSHPSLPPVESSMAAFERRSRSALFFQLSVFAAPAIASAVWKVTVSPSTKMASASFEIMPN